MIRRFGATRAPAFIAGVTVLAIAWALGLFLFGRQQVLWDSTVYLRLAEQIATRGLFQTADETRTFGYPLFLAIVWRFSDRVPSTIQFWVFPVQLLVFLSMCYLALKVFNRIYPRPALAAWLFAFLALNPLPLIYTGVVLSDLLSAVLDFVALLLAIQPPSNSPSASSGSIRARISSSSETFVFLSFLAAGCAAMVRPANLVIALAVAAVWLLRLALFKDGSLRALFAAPVGFLIPFVPQLINNYTAYGELQPLIVRSLYGEQLQWGMQYLKYVSVALPGNSTGTGYANPFWSPTMTSLSNFLSERPLEFLVTQAIHLFALFDYDYAFPYITDLNVLYRLPLAIANYALLFVALSGIVAWMPRVLRPSSFSRLDLALAAMLLAIAAYLPAHLFVAVEPRFSLPLDLFLTPFTVYALWRGREWLKWTHWRVRILWMLGLSIFLVLNLSLYLWLQGQAPFLDVRANTPIAPSHYTTKEIRAHLGERVELIRSQIYPMDQTKGGDTLYLVLQRQSADAVTESYGVQIELIDTSRRVWSEYQSLLPSQLPLLIAFRLPAAMPEGEYDIMLSLYDETTNRYIRAFEAFGGSFGEQLQIATLTIRKNKSSLTASALLLENAFFVDMGEMRFLGFTALPQQVQASSELDVGIYWRARSKPRGDYVATIQLRDGDGRVVVEQSARPAEETYPTTLWNAGEVLLDWHTLELPSSLPEGEYRLAALLFDVDANRPLGETEFAQIRVVK